MALGGRFALGSGLEVNRMGYGAMQLAGPGVFGPPRDRAECVAVLREAVEAGVDHIDTSDFYGPHITNAIIKEALHPYPEGLVIVTKVGARRGDDGAWNLADKPDELVSAVHDNLKNLGLDRIDVVNMRFMSTTTEVEPRLEPLIRLKEQGLIRHIGISTAGPEQLAVARSMTEIACVQNLYNVAHRADDAMIDDLAAAGIAYVPYFPLGGFSPLQSGTLDEVAKALGATPMQVALAWLLQRSPNILLIPGTSSRAHLRENLAAADLVLTPDALARLDVLGSEGAWSPPARH
jgi:aryl-alcohol dehydrogenase-like predicted oxidoreductase